MGEASQPCVAFDSKIRPGAGSHMEILRICDRRLRQKTSHRCACARAERPRSAARFQGEGCPHFFENLPPKMRPYGPVFMHTLAHALRTIGLYGREIKSIGEACGCLRSCNWTRPGFPGPLWISYSALGMVKKIACRYACAAMGSCGTAQASSGACCGS
jgi:hypothetical protein